ncbi:MAG TPA: arginase [Planctomycetota bacterium]|nr:arginase [Planctomycetota bacterium]
MTRTAAIIGVPLDLGANRRGVDMGPSALRVTGLADRLRALGYDVKDFGDVDVPLPEECDIGEPNKKFADDIREVCEDVCEMVLKALKQGRLPVVLGGDHSLAMGSIAASAKSFREKKKKVGVIWFDAHGDMNTPESTNSGNVHGMPLAHVLGMGDKELASIGGFAPKVDEANCALVGVRDLDEREKKLIHDSGVRVFTMKDIDQRGASKVMDEAIEVASKGTAGIHVSFDIDACDPSVAPGVGTPKKGGLNYREAHLCLEMVADSEKIVAMDLVEVNPIYDNRNHTAEFGAELILSAFGKSIF